MSGQYAVRLARGIITRFNDEPITDRAVAEQVVRSVELMYGEKGTIEMIVLDLPVDAEHAKTRKGPQA